MEVKEYDQGGEEAMQRHWQYDGAVYGTFDEAESKWPSSFHVSRTNIKAQGLITFWVSVLWFARRGLLVSDDGAFLAHYAQID